MAGPAYYGIGVNAVREKPVRDALLTIDKFLRGVTKQLSPGTTTTPAEGLPAEPYVVAVATSALTKRRVLTASTSVAVTDNGANSTLVPSVIMSGLTYAAPTVVLGTAAAEGSADTLLRTDATIVAFNDSGVPADLATAAADGGNAFASRNDHVHKFPTSLQSSANATTLVLTDDGSDQTLTSDTGVFILSTPSSQRYKSDVGIYEWYDQDGSTLRASIQLGTSVSSVIRFTPRSNTRNAATVHGFELQWGITNSSGSVAERNSYFSNMNFQSTSADTTAKNIFAARYRVTSNFSNTLGNNVADRAGVIRCDLDWLCGVGGEVKHLYGISIEPNINTAVDTPDTVYGVAVHDLTAGANRWAYWAETDPCWFQEVEINGDLNHDGSNIGFFGVAPTARAGATDDIKDALTLYGLAQGTSATPLNLDGGVLTAGSATLSTALTEANGGTAQSTYVQGDILHASAANTLANLAKGTAFQHLRMNSGATVPEWATDTKSKSILVEDPANGDRLALWLNEAAVTVLGVSHASLAGTSVLYNLEYAASIASGTVIHTDTCASATPEWDVSPSGTAAVPTDQIILLEITTVTGSVTDFVVTVHYRENA